MAQRRRPLADLGRRQQFPAAENDDLVEVGHRTLVAHGELGEAVHFVAPQVDAHRAGRGGGEDVHDRASDRQLAPVLHLVLPAVAEPDELLHQPVQVDLLPARHLDGLDVFDVRPEALEQGTDRGNYDRRGPGVGGPVPQAAQAPHELEATAHRLGPRADPLEGERLPGGEESHLVRAQPGPDLVGQPGGGGGTGNGHHDGAAGAVLGHRGDGKGLGRLGYGHGALGPRHQAGQAGVPVGQAQEGGQGPRRAPFAGGPPGPALLKPSGARHSDHPVALDH